MRKFSIQSWNPDPKPEGKPGHYLIKFTTVCDFKCLMYKISTSYKGLL